MTGVVAKLWQQHCAGHNVDEILHVAAKQRQEWHYTTDCCFLPSSASFHL
jgi:hypothetical protein